MSRRHLQPGLGLDPLPERLRGQTSLQESLHESHWAARRKIITSLAGSVLLTHKKWADRLSQCGNHASFFIDPSVGKVRPWISRCGHRLCPFCARSRSASVSSQIHQVLIQMPRPRILILTVRSTSLPLYEQLKNLRAWFRKLRDRKLWKSKVRGGCYTLEVTKNTSTGKWHPHLHVVFDGEYLPQQLLRKLWHEITGDSDIVYLQEVTDRVGAARELAKYIGKPQRISSLTDGEVREYAGAVQGCRMVQSFGNSYGVTVEDSDRVDREAPDTFRVPLGRLMKLAQAGHDTPQRLLISISKRYPAFTAYILHAMPQLDPYESAARKTLKMIQMLHGPGAASRGPPKKLPAREILDAELFIAFMRYKRELEAGEYGVLESEMAVT